MGTRVNFDEMGYFLVFSIILARSYSLYVLFLKM